MSKMNAVRIINLNYNNNAIKISDEIFELHGKSTLLSLQNGGGKSVLVQMMMSPFVHKRYQNAKDRPFTGYFTTNRPTIIMVEWKLDGGAGYLLNGMMIRKSQELAEENADELEMVNFICEYSKRCPQDIYHLEVVTKNKKEIVLKSYGACKQLFETLKKQRDVSFQYYDMNNSAQSRQYFTRLMEYNINYKEWESIVKKINVKESGLSELFTDCRDEKGLVEKWFLEVVENKLNTGKNRMQEFQNIVEKYVVQYKDNQSKILRRDAIRAFENEAGVIRSETLEYKELSDKRNFQEARIADFITRIQQLIQAAEEDNSSVTARINEVQDEIAHLEYEKLSGEIYDIQEKIGYSASNWELLSMEKQELEEEFAQITHKLHLLICAKQQEKLNEARQEYETENQKLAVCLERNSDLEPERKLIGGQLRRYYDGQISELREQSAQCNDRITAVNDEISDENEHREELLKSEKDIAGKIGAINQSIKGYDSYEAHFNEKYNTAFRRNILGEYEPGLLSITGKEYRAVLEQLERERITGKKELEEQKEKLKSSQRNLQDSENDRVRTEINLASAEEDKAQLEAELNDRRIILKYFDISEDLLFSMDEIIVQAFKKIRDTEYARNALVVEESAIQKEYRKLTQGQVLELDDDFKHMLDENGIDYIYGMEWLVRNQNSTETNQGLVARHPFLPYSLIMSKRELSKLSALTEKIYTSFPVPILERESLDSLGSDSGAGKVSVRRLNGASFYVWFNENLLDEQKLAVIVAAKEQGIKKVRDAIARKSQEYSDYIERLERIKNQRVTSGIYDEAEDRIRQLVEKLSVLDDDISMLRLEMSGLEESINELEHSITSLDGSIMRKKQMLDDFGELSAEYQVYMEDTALLEKKQKEQERLENQKKLNSEKLAKLAASLQTLQSQLDGIIKQLDENKSKYAVYEKYAEGSDNNTDYVVQCLSAEEALIRESRYIAISTELSAEQSELERRVETASRRKQTCQDELDMLCDKYGLEPDQWLETVYDRKEETHMEVEQEDHRLKIELKNRQLNDERVITEKYRTEEDIRRKELKKKCGTDELLPKNEIVTLDYDVQINEKEYQKKNYEKEVQNIQRRLRGYEELMTALAEYVDFTCDISIEWDVNLENMDSRELARLKGVLIRDYNAFCSDITAKRGDIDRLLSKISRMEMFQESFYQKPLEALMNLTGNADQIIRQLDTILQSFGNLIEKLLVDISIVEKEKSKVIELLEDYLNKVHLELGKIDHNSTINIRNKAVKMLKIGLPDWAENEGLYQLRLQDYIDDVTLKSVEILSANKNIIEYLGTRITTSALYDAVVGIANVQIRMYKIEAQREYPITWSDVAKNSGGEGFLSAFVILSSLLHYMRKDDSDIFADSNEGKVLIMDNPFAQTNAAHLLKPLMDMAKKTNTQLICLSGLGGESIYSRFDNIYVLNLIAANLRGGMQYLKADHIRGSEEETMLVSQIEVVEQQQLELEF